MFIYILITKMRSNSLLQAAPSQTEVLDDILPWDVFGELILTDIFDRHLKRAQLLKTICNVKRINL